MDKKNLNGKKTKIDASHKVEMNFPVTFVLKLMITLTETQESHWSEIESLLIRHQLSHQLIRKNLSNKGNYLSYSIQVTLLDHDHMAVFYADLKKLKGFKLAL